MQAGTPFHKPRRVGRFPEFRNQGAQQQLLCQAHLRIGWHLERTQLKQAQAACGGVGAVQLVDTKFAAVGVASRIDQNVAQKAIDNPRRRVASMLLHLPIQLSECQFKFVNLIAACFVYARGLAGGANKQA